MATRSRRREISPRGGRVRIVIAHRATAAVGVILAQAPQLSGKVTGEIALEDDPGLGIGFEIRRSVASSQRTARTGSRVTASRARTVQVAILGMPRQQLPEVTGDSVGCPIRGR
jgi:hypothetical protein